MNYKLRHVTTYRYSKAVTFARCALRLTPQQGPDQTVLTSSITITPPPSRLQERIGQFGERVVTAIIDTPHRELRIEARSDVAVHRASLLPGFTGASWDCVREEAAASVSLDMISPAHFIYPTAMTRLNPAITAYVTECFQPGRSVVEAAHALSCRIKAEFTYDPDATLVSTPAIHAFKARRGVCQDFAHIMISGLRGLGLPAAYVSGYLRTIPPPGKPRLEGADATHAWVDLWCGKALGWVGFDPTNALIVAGDHVVLAVGRDYADVAPMGGVVLGPGDQTIEVAVDVVPGNETQTLEDEAWRWARSRA
ncbi:transglutaminase family protein [Caulobacter sp. S45]|uniref:transglutaminase family protein n=1 Tax=Caulobacter sp. S45 TaxID=1641861 RepID=UPI00131AEF81|nr:transglutaminase family protein [Caulobacter sp. S45]